MEDTRTKAENILGIYCKTLSDIYKIWQAECCNGSLERSINVLGMNILCDNQYNATYGHSNIIDTSKISGIEDIVCCAGINSSFYKRKTYRAQLCALHLDNKIFDIGEFEKINMSCGLPVDLSCGGKDFFVDDKEIKLISVIHIIVNNLFNEIVDRKYILNDFDYGFLKGVLYKKGLNTIIDQYKNKMQTLVLNMHIMNQMDNIGILSEFVSIVPKIVSKFDDIIRIIDGSILLGGLSSNQELNL